MSTTSRVDWLYILIGGSDVTHYVLLHYLRFEVLHDGLVNVLGGHSFGAGLVDYASGLGADYALAYGVGGGAHDTLAYGVSPLFFYYLGLVETIETIETPLGVTHLRVVMGMGVL